MNKTSITRRCGSLNSIPPFSGYKKHLYYEKFVPNTINVYDINTVLKSILGALWFKFECINSNA